MNVNWIHNEQFAQVVPEETIARARALANYHEYGVFTSPEVDGIGNSEPDIPSNTTGTFAHYVARSREHWLITS